MVLDWPQGKPLTLADLARVCRRGREHGITAEKLSADLDIPLEAVKAVESLDPGQAEAIQSACRYLDVPTAREARLRQQLQAAQMAGTS